MNLDNYDVAGIIVLSILALMFFAFCITKAKQFKNTKKDPTIKACTDCKHCRKKRPNWLTYPYWKCAAKPHLDQYSNPILGTVEPKTKLRY